MKLTAQEITDLVQGKLSNTTDTIFTGAAGLTEAGGSDISFLANPKYTSLLQETRAGLVLIPEQIPGIPGKPTIAVKNPQLAFAKILTILAKELNPRLTGIHPSAVIAPSAVLGKGVAVGPYAVIEDNVIIGDNTTVSAQCYIGHRSHIGSDCLIYPQVTVREDIRIGSNVIIHSGTVVGSDGFGFVPGREGHFKIPQIGIVEIGDWVEIGANAAIDRATTGKTIIGKGTKIDNLVHIAHNIHIGEHCMLTAQVGFAGSTTLGNFVTIGGQSGVSGHLNVGNNVTIAGRCGVIKDVPDNETVSGFPARPHREEMRLQAYIHKLPELFEELKKIKKKVF